MPNDKGRPKKGPHEKRVKVQPWVHPTTKQGLEDQARDEGTTIGHIADKWFKQRATQNSKTSAVITQKTKTDLPKETTVVLDEEEPLI